MSGYLRISKDPSILEVREKIEWFTYNFQWNKIRIRQFIHKYINMYLGVIQIILDLNQCQFNITKFYSIFKTLTKVV